MNIDAEAKSLMNNPAFAEAIEKAQAQCVRGAMMCAVDDDTGRRRYLDAARTVEKVVGHLNALVAASKSGAEVDPADYYEERARGFLALFKK